MSETLILIFLADVTLNSMFAVRTVMKVEIFVS